MFTRETWIGTVAVALIALALAYLLGSPDASTTDQYAKHIATKAPEQTPLIQHRHNVAKELVHLTQSESRWTIECQDSSLCYLPGEEVIEEMTSVTGSLDQLPLCSQFLASNAQVSYFAEQLTFDNVETQEGGHADHLLLQLDQQTATAVGNVHLSSENGDVSSDWMHASRPHLKASFSGHVAVQTDDGEAYSHSLHLIGEEHRNRIVLKEATWSGDVQMHKGTKRVCAAQAIYRPQERELCLTATSGQFVTLTDRDIPRVQAESLVIDPVTARVCGVGRVRLGLDDQETTQIKEALLFP